VRRKEIGARGWSPGTTRGQHRAEAGSGVAVPPQTDGMGGVGGCGGLDHVSEMSMGIDPGHGSGLACTGLLRGNGPRAREGGH
jgi:hypothetical protein